MGVYINGIEMPTGNDELRLIIRSNGQVIISHQTYYEEAEAVPVPPHGRLIEKNAVFELLRSFPNVDRQLPVEFMKALYELPIIIPAEGGRVMNCKFCGASCTCAGKDRDKVQCLGFEPITNQEAMARLSPEEFYKKMHWLLFSYGSQFNSTELAVIDWLKQEAKQE